MSIRSLQGIAAIFSYLDGYDSGGIPGTFISGGLTVDGVDITAMQTTDDPASPGFMGGNLTSGESSYACSGGSSSTGSCVSYYYRYGNWVEEGTYCDASSTCYIEGGIVVTVSDVSTDNLGNVTISSHDETWNLLAGGASAGLEMQMTQYQSAFIAGAISAVWKQPVTGPLPMQPKPKNPNAVVPLPRSFTSANIQPLAQAAYGNTLVPR